MIPPILFILSLSLIYVSGYQNSTLIDKDTLKLSLDQGTIPLNLIPYLNLTAVHEGQVKNNGSLDFIITDEDVADIPDDDTTVLQVNELVNDGNKTIVKISEEAIYQLMQRWVDQAASGVMSAVVNKKINERKLTKLDKIEHNNCTNNATSVPSHAKCVVSILNKLEDRKRRLRKFKKLKFYREKGRRVRRNVPEEVVEIQQKTRYELKEKSDTISPFGMIAKHLTNVIQEQKKKSGKPKKWMSVLQEIKEEVGRLKSKKKTRESFQRKFAKYSRAMRSLGIDPKEAFRRMDMASFISDNNDKDEDTTEPPTENEKMMRKPMMMIREGIKLGMMMAGKNVSNFDERKVSVISPQFMSVLPDDKMNDTVSLLSPSVFALHDQGTDLEKSLSLSQAMKMLSDSGQEDWMNFVLEASGATEAVERMREKEREEEMKAWKEQFTNDRGQPMYFTKENVTEMYGDYEATKLNTMEQLHRSMSANQMSEMNSTGFAIMNQEQIQQFYGDGSPYNDSYAHKNYMHLSRDQVPEMIETNIHKMASEEFSFKLSRRKDLVLSPVMFTWIVLSPKTASQSIILSPLVFSPLVLSPSVLGPLIVSPWIFTPLILSPRVLAPIIVSPTIFSPIILSPLCLSPLILSPAVAVPLILSPFVFTPFILTPVVMVPLILNPFCLSPFIGVPNTLSPFILSPFVLSPLILSPPIVNAFVLSPYALSPVIWSDGYMFTAVLSPSWLSSV